MMTTSMFPQRQTEIPTIRVQIRKKSLVQYNCDELTNRF